MVEPTPTATPESSPPAAPPAPGPEASPAHPHGPGEARGVKNRERLAALYAPGFDA